MADADQWLPLQPDLVKARVPHGQSRGHLFVPAANPEEVSIRFC
jgi:hypothetical protein